MAVNDFDQWIPVEYSPDVIQRVKQMSAVIAHGQPVPMTTQSRSTPRSGGVIMGGIAKGGSYDQDTTTTNDDVWLYAQKYGSAVPIAEEDLNDSLADIVNSKTVDAATSFAKLYDNSCLGVTAAKSSTSWAFDSLYYILSQTDATVDYTANANITQTATGGLTYANTRAPLAKVEQSDFYDPAGIVVIAHPAFADGLRSILDANDRPIFNESSNGTAGGGQGGVPTLFSHPLHWSLGAKTAATPSQAPGGNPLLIIASKQYLMVGNREPLSIQSIDGTTGLGALSDTAYLKFRARKAFAPGHPKAFAILEWVS
jgi:HK97 family phage major capsid protein